MENNRKPLTMDDAIIYTGFKRSYLHKLCHLKKIPYFKPLNGKIYFQAADLEAFVYRNRVAADFEEASHV